jgi:hypothetical protein
MKMECLGNNNYMYSDDPNSAEYGEDWIDPDDTNPWT